MSAVRLACRRMEAWVPRDTDWLSHEEAARLAGIASVPRRAQYLAARWLARELLAAAAGGAPRDWALSAGEAVKPTVIGHPGMHVSISHSGDWVACAVSNEPVGVDLEAPARPRDIEGLLAMCCTESEQRLFSGLAASAREALFYELWTVKESWLKRRGEWVAPQRLLRVEARPQAQGAVRTWRGEGRVLALCATGKVLWSGDAPQACGTWAVRDL